MMEKIRSVTEKPRLLALVLGLLGLVLYLNTIPNNYNVDDELVAINHPLTSQGISAIPEIFTSYYYNDDAGNNFEYRPIVLVTFALEHSLFGDNPHISHAINALIYALTCFLLFFVVKLFKPDANWALPFVVVAIFTVHPLHTEVVASIKNRDELLAFLFGLAAIYFALLFARQGKLLNYTLFLAMFSLAMLSKRTILNYTLIIPLAAVWLSDAKLLRLLALSFPLSVAFLLFSPNKQDIFVNLASLLIFIFPIVCYGFKQLMVLPSFSLKSWLQQPYWEQPMSTVSIPNRTSTRALVLHLLVLLYAVLFPYGLVYFGSVYFLALSAIIWAILWRYTGRDNRVLFFQALLFSAVVFYHLLLAKEYLIENWVTVLYLLVFMPIVLVNGAKRKMLAAIPAVLFFILTPVYIEYFLSRLIAYTALSIVTLLLFQLKNKKAVIGIFAITSAILLYYIATGVKVLPNIAILLVFGLMMAPYFKDKSKTWLVPTIIASLFSVGFIAHHFQKLDYTPRAKEIAVAPSNGTSRTINIVPNAGRSVDPVENPLVNVKDKGTRAATAIKVTGYYTWLMVAPLQLRYYYGFNQIPLSQFNDPWVWCTIVLLLVMLVVAIRVFNTHRLLSFGILYLLVSLFFISNIGVLLTGIVGERLAYSGSLGFSIIIGCILFWGLKLPMTHKISAKEVRAVGIITLLLISTFGVRTLLRNFDWKDKLTLYVHDGKILQQSAKAQQLLGFEYLRLAQSGTNPNVNFPLAEQHLKQSIAIAPKFHTALYYLGLLAFIKEDYPNAIAYFERHIAVSPPPPDLCFYYASSLDAVARLNDAIVYYEKAIALQPTLIGAYSNLSYIYYRQNRLDLAVRINTKAIEAMPNEPDPYINLGKTYLDMNEPSKALQYYEKAYTLLPNDINLLLILADMHSQIGDKNRGQFFYNRAIELGYKP